MSEQEYYKAKADKLRNDADELIRLRNNWESLKDHLDPDTIKPVYWNYITAQSIAATMEALEDKL